MSRDDAKFLIGMFLLFLTLVMVLAAIWLDSPIRAGLSAVVTCLAGAAMLGSLDTKHDNRNDRDREGSEDG